MEVFCPVCSKRYRISEDKFSAPVIKGRCSRCRSILNIPREGGRAEVVEGRAWVPTSDESDLPQDTDPEGVVSSVPEDPDRETEPETSGDDAESPSEEKTAYPGNEMEKRERDWKAFMVFLAAFLALVIVAILGVRNLERSTLFNQLKSISRITGIFDETAQRAKEKFKKKQRRPRSRYQKHMTKAHHYFRDKKYDKALEQYNLAIRSEPGKSNPYYWRGQVLARLGKHELAIEDMSKVLQLDPSYSKAHQMLGWIYTKAGRYDEAIQELDRYIAIDPKDGWSYFERGFCYHQLGDTARALKDAKKACDLGYKTGCDVYKRYQKG